MTQVLLRYYVVLLRSRPQVQESRTPHSDAHPKILGSGTRFREPARLPGSAICDLESQDVAFPTRSGDLIIGCLDPRPAARALGAADCGATSASECHAVCGDAMGSSHSAGNSPGRRDRAPRYRARAGSGAAVPARTAPSRGPDHHMEASRGSARTPLVLPAVELVRRLSGVAWHFAHRGTCRRGCLPRCRRAGRSPSRRCRARRACRSRPFCTRPRRGRRCRCAP